jgi:uncharacterized protein YbaR (Trm112 family)
VFDVKTQAQARKRAPLASRAMDATWPPPLDELLSLMQCPATGETLQREGHALWNQSRSRRYPVIDEVPVLIAAERSLFDPADYERDAAMDSPLVGALRRLVGQTRALGPALGKNQVADANLAAFGERLRAQSTPGERLRVLVVGGATAGAGIGLLTSAEDIDVLETDVRLTDRVALVCDGHDLPFRDATFDGVVCQAVLEHVLELPFRLPVQGGAFDFTRFTHLGHRRLWRRFDEISSGADTGPGMALAWSIWFFVRALLPRRLGRLADLVVPLLFFWLKYLDPWLVYRPAALDAASGTYFLGSRRDDEVDDRVIVNGYRGTVGRMPNLRLTTDDQA